MLLRVARQSEPLGAFSDEGIAISPLSLLLLVFSVNLYLVVDTIAGIFCTLTIERRIVCRIAIYFHHEI